MSFRPDTKAISDRSHHLSDKASTSTRNRMDDTHDEKGRTDKNDDINKKFSKLSYHRHSGESRRLAKERSSSSSTSDSGSKPITRRRRSQSEDRKERGREYKRRDEKSDGRTTTTSLRQHNRSNSPQSRHSKSTTEKIPYFADAKREQDRIRRKYGQSSSTVHSERRSRSDSRRRRSRSSSRRRQSRPRTHSRERRRSSPRRSYSRERRHSCHTGRCRSSSRDRYRSSRRHSRSPRRYDDRIMEFGGQSYIPFVPIPYHGPGFMPPPYGARFPAVMLRPPYLPPVPYYMPPMPPGPMHRMNRPFRPRRNQQN